MERDEGAERSVATVSPSNATVSATRRTLHLVAAHVLGRRRHEVSGRFGLRASPGGFATPAYGPESEVLRLSAGALVREIGGSSAMTNVTGSSLRKLAEFAGTNVDRAFQAGAQTPQLERPDAMLILDADASTLVADWFALGWKVLDGVISTLPEGSEPATIQLWPEHFDAATTVDLGAAGHVNLGFSAGDDFCDQPYLYVGPWGTNRPGSPEYWNASFGATLPRSLLDGASDPASTCTDFLLRGLRYLSEGVNAP